MLARRPLCARPWQLVPNGDLEQALDEAVHRVGRSQVAATGVKAHAAGGPLGHIVAPDPFGTGNTQADELAKAGLTDLADSS
eukprot:9247712-Alexandrium_andersonii.AAC.1